MYQKQDNRGYRPKWFELYELLPPEVYTYQDLVSDKDQQPGWSYLDERLLITLDIVRDIIGKPLICNTWCQNGSRMNAGYRTIGCSVGAKKSMHKEGKAADLLCRDYTAEEMRQIIIANQDKLPYPIRMEADVTWLHIDVKDMDYKGRKIYIFKG